MRGGGVAIYLKDLYNYSIIPSQFSQSIFESVSIIVEIPGVEKFLVSSLYKPPTCNDSDFFELLHSHLDSLEKFKFLFLFVQTRT